MIFGFVFDQCLQRKPTNPQAHKAPNFTREPSTSPTSQRNSNDKAFIYKEGTTGSRRSGTSDKIGSWFRYSFAYLALDLATQFYQNTLRINHFPTNNPVLNKVAFRSDCQTPLSLIGSIAAETPFSIFRYQSLSLSLFFPLFGSRKP